MQHLRWFLFAALIGCDDAEIVDTDDTDEPSDTDNDDTDDTDEPEGLAIVGEYVDEWGTDHDIDETTWTQTFPGGDSAVYHLGAYDNDERWVVAQNDTDNEWNADLYSRFDWHADGGDLWFCQTVFDAATEDDARDATPADASDLDAGCGGFSWTALTP